MKVLLTNQNSVLNLGDFAIHLETLRMVREACPEAEVTLTYHDLASAREHLPGYRLLPALDSWAYQVNERGEVVFTPVLRRIIDVLILCLGVLIYRFGGATPRLFRDQSKHEVFAAFASADIVLACGGGYIYDTELPRGLPSQLISFATWSIFLLGSHLLALALGKPLVLLPQSIGPLRDPVRQRVVAWIISQARLTLVRERESLALLDELGCGAKVAYSPDLAFGMPGGVLAEARALLDTADLPHESVAFCVGMTALDWRGQSRAFDGQERYERALLGCIDAITADSGMVVLFAQCHSQFAAWDDKLVNRRLRERARQPERVVLVEQLAQPDILQAAYGQMDYFIGTRMHSVILAANAGVPALAIGYLHKSLGIMREIGLAERCFDIASVSAELLIEGLSKLRNAPDTERIAAYVEHARRRKHALAALLPMLAGQTYHFKP